ncbi:MAG TPA: hypothetical protein VK914_01160 [bacterium]|nr:hypothetical protein [bacterium]
MTFVELMVLVAILGMASYSMSRFILSTRQAASRQDAATEMLQRSLRSLSNLRAGLQGCVEILANYGDGTGDAMLPIHNMLVASVAASESLTAVVGPPAPVSYSAWPTVETVPQVDMSDAAGDTSWGNEIMYVAELNPITFTAYYNYNGSAWISGADLGNSSDAEVLSVMRLQFVYDYLAHDPRTLVPGSGEGLRLVEWRSQPFIDYTSLSTLTDTPGTYAGNTCCPRLAAACAYLSAAGYNTAFDPTYVTQSAGDNCFFPIVEANISGGIPENLPATFPMYSWAYLDDYDLVQSFGAKPGVMIGRVTRADGYAGGQTASPASYSVALNDNTGASSSTTVVGLQGAGGAAQVPAYAQANYVDADNLGGPGFPSGFEVAIAGQINSREIVMHLVLMAANAGTTSPGVFQALAQTSEISVATQSDY